MSKSSNIIGGKDYTGWSVEEVARDILKDLAAATEEVKKTAAESRKKLLEKINPALVISGLCDMAYDTAKSKGWWDCPPEFGTTLSLIHAELSEALEWARNGNGESDHIKGFTGIEEEFADVLIRIFDYSAAKNLRLGEAVLAKMQYNATREYKHGGKKF